MGHGGDLSDRVGRPRDIASDIEVLDGLLSTLTDVLDIREVFDRGSTCRGTIRSGPQHST